MQTKDLINSIKGWYGAEPSKKYRDEIIQCLLELDELKEKIKELKLFLNDVSKYVA